MMTRRLAVVSMAALAALVAPAGPASASHVPPVCTDLATDTPEGFPYARASVCVSPDTGLYGPIDVTCTTISGCSVRVTTGHQGTADVHGEVCAEGPGVAQVCVRLGSGEVPLVAIPPQTICVNDSPWGPPCEP